MNLMLDQTTKQRFEEALASGKLKELSDQMMAAGLSQVQIYCLFELFDDFLGVANREADSDTLRDSLECIVGWCAPQARWFDHFLTNEEIYAHKTGLTEQEVKEIAALVLTHTEDQIFCAIRRTETGELTVHTARAHQGMFTVGTIFTVRRRLGGWEIVGERRK